MTIGAKDVSTLEATDGRAVLVGRRVAGVAPSGPVCTGGRGRRQLGCLRSWDLGRRAAGWPAQPSRLPRATAPTTSP